MEILGGTPGVDKLESELLLYQANEKRINKIYLYLLYITIISGATMIIFVKVFLPVKATFSLALALYILIGGLVGLSLPTYLHFYQPDHRINKFILVGCNIGLVVFINIILAGRSADSFLNYFWTIIFTVLYFNRTITFFAVTASAVSYLLLVIIVPETHPLGFQSFQASVAVRLFYLLLAGAGCTVIITLANSLMKRLGSQERISQEALNDLNQLLQEIARGSRMLTDMSQDLSATVDEARVSMEETSAVVGALTSEATENREGMTRAQSLLNYQVEQSDRHRDLAAQAVQLTENIVVTAEKILENASETKREVGEVVEQFDSIRETVELLNQDSQNIGAIVQTIHRIAKQTRMLSLNASIEAARAGEYGRGFAIVASRIRDLSEQTEDASKQIDRIITEFLPQLALTVTKTQNSAASFERGGEAVNQMTRTFEEIIRTLQNGLPVLQGVTRFIASQAETTGEIAREVNNAHGFTVATEDGMKCLNLVTSELHRMTQTIMNLSSELKTLAESLNKRTEESGKNMDTTVETENAVIDR